VDRPAIELVGVLGCLGHADSSWGGLTRKEQVNAAPCQAWWPQPERAMLQAMSSAGRVPLQPTYPYWLAGKPAAPNHDLEVRDKYSGEVATRVALADAQAIDGAIAAAVEAAGPRRRVPGHGR